MRIFTSSMLPLLDGILSLEYVEWKEERLRVGICILSRYRGYNRPQMTKEKRKEQQKEWHL